MAIRWTKLLGRRFLRLAVVAFILYACIITILPYDNKHRVGVLHQLNRLTSAAPKSVDKWLTQTPAPLWTNWKEDVGIIVKSGYGTQHRMPAWLAGARNADNDIVLIADFATGPGEQLLHRGRKLPVYDVIGNMVEQGALTSGDLGLERVKKYLKMAEAIKAGYLEQAKELSKSFGWELDAMKFISGLELAYKKMPHKKWYLLVDDDTYIVQPSLTLLLDRLDPEDKHYIGNAIGGVYGRFAHGGSGVIISRGAMRHLFSPQNEKIVLEAKRESVREVYGDRMLALAFMRVGIIIDEKYSRYFNGERPIITKIRPDRFCAPIFSFHGHAKPEDMQATGKMFRDAARPVRWFDVWGMYQAPSLESWVDTPMRPSWDHVGRLDEYTWTVRDVNEAGACLEMCQRRKKECLAWTWAGDKQECNMSPWMIVGDVATGSISGINAALAKKLAAEC